MEIVQFAKLIQDKDFSDLKKMTYKYSKEMVGELVQGLKDMMYMPLPLKDFHGNPIVIMNNAVPVRPRIMKSMMKSRDGEYVYSVHAMEEEIYSTLSIENIESERRTIRKALDGYAPVDTGECRAYMMKRGLDFIADQENKITEENMKRLYDLMISELLEDDYQLLAGNNYRHDNVYVVGTKVVHQGLPAERLPEYMSDLVDFINQEDDMNDLVKAAVIHYYLAYLHPYFDGNGRMARMLHLWYLVQQGYASAMFISLSSYIYQSREQYYKAYTLINQNAKISKVLDVTPFVLYFIQSIYNKLVWNQPNEKVLRYYYTALTQGQVTEKEKSLWNYVLAAYGTEAFSTKQLEKDYGNAAYATIRSFVMKFEGLGLLRSQRYSNRVKYRVVKDSEGY